MPTATTSSRCDEVSSKDGRLHYQWRKSRDALGRTSEDEDRGAEDNVTRVNVKKAGAKKMEKFTERSRIKVVKSVNK